MNSGLYRAFLDSQHATQGVAGKPIRPKAETSTPAWRIRSQIRGGQFR
jgi:hypothetical protein